MLCQNCGNHEGNIKYTQIINGEKKRNDSFVRNVQKNLA